MKRDRNLQIKMMRKLRGDSDSDYQSVNEDLIIYNGALLIEEGLVRGSGIKGVKGLYVGVKLIELTSLGHDFLEKEDRKYIVEDKLNKKMTIFISHATEDEELAGAIGDLLRVSFGLLSSQIRCTSVLRYSLPTGVHIESHLKGELKDSTVFIGVLTPSSLASTWVLFELGSRWGQGLAIFPIVARGVDIGQLSGPLKGLHTLYLKDISTISKFIEDLERVVGVSSVRYHSAEAEYHKVLDASLNSSIPKNTNQELKVDNALTAREEEILNWLFDLDAPKNLECIQDQFLIGSGITQYHLDNLIARNFVKHGHSRSRATAFDPVSRRFSVYSITAQGRAHVVQKIRSDIARQ